MSDYSRLVNKAEKQLAEKEKQKKPEGRKTGFNINTDILAIVILVVVVGINAYIMMPKLTDSQIESDLELLVNEAHTSIQQYLRDNGNLPPQIPEPGLRAFMEYRVLDAQTTPPKYELRARIREVEHVSQSRGRDA